MTFLYAYLALYALFLLYVLAMGFKRAWPKLLWWEKVLAAPTVVTAVLWDWFMNWTVFTAWFWERPASWKELVTARLKRYHGAGYEGSRHQRQGKWICDRLDHFDPDGDHC